MSDILKADRWLSLMRVFSILPFCLAVIITVLSLPLFADAILVPDLNVYGLVNNIIWPLLYMTEVIVYILRYNCKAIQILICLHPEYRNNSFSSLLFFRYLKKIRTKKVDYFFDIKKRSKDYKRLK